MGSCNSSKVLFTNIEIDDQPPGYFIHRFREDSSLMINTFNLNTYIESFFEDSGWLAEIDDYRTLLDIFSEKLDSRALTESCAYALYFLSNKIDSIENKEGYYELFKISGGVLLSRYTSESITAVIRSLLEKIDDVESLTKLDKDVLDRVLAIKRLCENYEKTLPQRIDKERDDDFEVRQKAFIGEVKRRERDEKEDIINKILE